LNLQEFNKQSAEIASQQLFACCGSQEWSKAVLQAFPFSSEPELVKVSTEIWYQQCNEKDWLEAFSHHPKIGDLQSLTEKFAGKEQAAVASATKEIIIKLAEANHLYEAKFGFIFIVCATGKSAQEMLDLLSDRLQNSRAEELAIAMGEQQKITIIRFRKMLETANWSFLKSSHITTHVLDTSIGKPGHNICIKLKDDAGKTIAQGRTNADGRIPDLLPPGRFLNPATYKMHFDTASYFQQTNQTGFYPEPRYLHGKTSQLGAKWLFTVLQPSCPAGPSP
jgi:5-hydroxyisourate hydrolase/2-oxo-4-hydroxy-4-carboxy-5-ureidoimidazoline decarboxylase